MTNSDNYGDPILITTPKGGGQEIKIYGEDNAQALREDPDFETKEYV